MAKLISDKSFLNDNILRHEKRLESQYTIFLDKTPTFVTYYHINDVNSTTDSGFKNIDQVLGPNSPLRFNMVKDFPIYGLDQIELALQDEDEGLNIDFDGDAIILPNTLKPYPNDHFTISYLGKTYVFMINSVSYDTIKSNNFYKINYHLKASDETTLRTLEKQVIEKYSTIFKNIGTEDKCILRDTEIDVYNKLSRLYEYLMSKYITYFYSEKYNSILDTKEDGTVVYDKYLTHFIQSNNLLYRKEDYKTFMLSNEDWNTDFDYEYDNSPYYAIEHKDAGELDYVSHLYVPITYSNSRFRYWGDNAIKSVLYVDFGDSQYIPHELIDKIKSERTDETSNDVYEQLLIGFFADKYENITRLPLDDLREIKIKRGTDDMIKIPLILFILRFYAERFMSVRHNQ